MTLTVGQSLWFVGSRYSTSRGGELVTVTKVGRVWAAISNGHRIALDGWIADGGQYSAPGCCYESKEAYEKIVSDEKAWLAFRRRIDANYNRPKFCSAEALAQAETLIFGPPPTTSGQTP